MATIKSYTDLSQSKKLAEILPLESADYHYIAQGEKSYFCPYSLLSAAVKDYDEEIKYIPCWSLAALFSILPNFIGDYGKCLYYDVGGYYCGYMVDGDFMLTIEETKADNQVDACVEMILYLNELNLL